MNLTLRCSLTYSNLIRLLVLQKLQGAKWKTNKKMSVVGHICCFFPLASRRSVKKNIVQLSNVKQHKSRRVNHFHTIPKITAFPSISLMKLLCVCVCVKYRLMPIFVCLLSNPHASLCI